MKKLLSIFFIILIICGVCCKKDVERGEVVEFRQQLSERRSLAFNGAISYKEGIEIFETRFDKVSNDCEVFGMFGGMQAGIRKSNKLIFFLDYSVDMNVIPIGDGAATMFSVNTFKWYRIGDRWRISINNDDIAEFTATGTGYAMVGFGMCSGVMKKVTWQPAFVFNGQPTDNISPIWGGRGVIRIDLSNNKVEGSER